MIVHAEEVRGIVPCRQPQSMAEWAALPSSDEGLLRIRDDLEKRGGVVSFPSGIFRFNESLLLTSTAGRIVGAHRGSASYPYPKQPFGTVFSYGEADDFLSVTGDDFTFENICFFPLRYSQARTLHFKTGSFLRDGNTYSERAIRAGAKTCAFYYCGVPIAAEGVVHLQVEDAPTFVNWGQAGLHLFGSAAQAMEGADIEKFSTYQASEPSTVNSSEGWIANHEYTAGHVLTHNGHVFQAFNTGLSAAVGLGPAPGDYYYSTDPHALPVQDGAVQWKYVCRADLAGIWIDHHSFHINIAACKLNNVVNAVRSSKTAEAGSHPNHVEVKSLECDQGMGDAIKLEAGENYTFHPGCMVQGARGNGMAVLAGFEGDLAAYDFRATNCGKHGIYQEAGPKDTTLVAPRCSGNSIQQPNTYDDIHFEPGCTDFDVIGYRTSSDTKIGTPRHNVYVGASCDKFLVTHAKPGVVYGSNPAFKNDAGDGINKLFMLNLPYTGEVIKGPFGQVRVDCTFDPDGSVNFLLRNEAKWNGSAWVHEDNVANHQQLTFRFRPDGGLRVRNDKTGQIVMETTPGNPVADKSALLLLVNLGGLTQRQIEIGAADSAGAGFRALRVAN